MSLEGIVSCDARWRGLGAVLAQRALAGDGGRGGERVRIARALPRRAAL